MLNVTLEHRTGDIVDLGTFEVAGVWGDEVWGNLADSGWTLLAMWSDERNGWQDEDESSRVFDNLYIAATDLTESGTSSPAMLAALTLSLVPVSLLLVFVASVAGWVAGVAA